MEAFVDAAHRGRRDAGPRHRRRSGEFRVRGPDGPKRHRPARRSPVSGVWIVLEDVTELRRLQQIRTEFVDNLSHELRTPLSTISLLAETLSRDADAAGDAVPAKMRERIGKIEVETGHLAQMVNELLDLARIESGGPLVCSTTSTWAGSSPSRPSASACSPSARASASSSTCRKACRASAATRPASARCSSTSSTTR